MTPQRDGGDPQLVYVATFTAVAGDSLLIAFSSDIENSGHTANKTATPAGYVGMKVDNIRLIDGPKPSQCTDVPPVTIVPTSLTPLEAGGTSVTVAGIDSTATNVKVLADNVVIGSVSPDSATQLDVPIDTDPVEPGVQPLVAGTTLTAKQTVNVNGILTESCQCPGAIGPMVGKGINSGIRVALGIRETGGAGPVGADGGITGNIEWVGSSSVKGADGQPIGKLLATGVDWQEVTFRWEAIGGTDLVAGFTGNGVVDGAWGVLESLNFTLEDSTNTGHYEVYVDAIYSGSTLLTGFEGLTNGSLALFRAPSHSGTTDTNLLDWPDSAAVTGAEAFEGTQAHKLMFQFVDNQPKRWVRITSVYDAAANPPMPTMPVQNPMIDLTQPITMRIKLYGVPPCGAVYADIEPDGDVDMDDFAEFQRCLTIGGGGAYPSECACFDHDFNNAIDENDLTSFSACASGANVPAVAGCGN